MNNGHKDITAAQSAGTQELSNGRPPTSVDVGKLAGVSRSTVSLVLNQVPDSRIPNETRERVLAAADELGYIPHAAASALRGGHSNLVLIPIFNRPYSYAFNVFNDGLAGRLTELGYMVMFHRDREAKGIEVVRQWASLRPVGVIAESHRLNDQARGVLTKSGTQAILALDANQYDQEDSEWIGNEGNVAAQHLNAAGHRWLGVVVPREPDLLQLGLRRLRGVEQVARIHALSVERIDLALDRQAAFILAQRWRRNPHPSGVFAYNDDYAMMLMNALLDQGLTIPGDVAIVGCDNLRFCEFLRPRLTSIEMHPDLAGRALAERFHTMISGQPQLSAELTTEPTLIIRESA